MLSEVEGQEQKEILSHFVESIQLTFLDVAEKRAEYTMRIYPEIQKGKSGVEFSRTATQKTAHPLTTDAKLRQVGEKAPQFDHSSQLTFTELGLCLLTTSRKERNVHLIPWGDPNTVLKPKTRVKAKHDPMVRARFYQSLLDNRVVESRAALSRYLGVTRARVTQVLRRLRDGP